MTWRCHVTAPHDPHRAEKWLHGARSEADCVGGPMTLRMVVDEILGNASAVDAEFGAGERPTSWDQARDVLHRLGFTDEEIEGDGEIEDRGRFA